MKSVTEFSNLKLADGLQAKTAFATEGKSPEEIMTAMGEKFKLEGDKLKCFVNALEVAGQTTEKLFRIKVVKLNEGQNPPARATVIEDLCYISELQTSPEDIKKAQEKAAAAAAAAASAKDSRGGKGGDRGGKGGGKGGGKPKSSPWGAMPEEKEAKLAAARQAAREKSLAGK
jgi:hypothetical protein